MRERESTSALGFLWDTELDDDSNEVHLLIDGSNGVPYLKELVVIAIPHLSLSLSLSLLCFQNPLFIGFMSILGFSLSAWRRDFARRS
jgi:hypothetical protein